MGDSKEQMMVLGFCLGSKEKAGDVAINVPIFQYMLSLSTGKPFSKINVSSQNEVYTHLNEYFQSTKPNWDDADYD